MQEDTLSDKLHALKRNVLPNPYCIVPTTILPRELLNEDVDLQDMARRNGICFARIERRICEDLFRIRIAADPSHLDDDEYSYVLFVSPEVLCTVSEIIQITSAIIPRELLKEDRLLEQIARRYMPCFARIERQIHWDLYYVRIAADPQSLYDSKRSHPIYLSHAEVQTYMGYPLEKVEPAEDTTTCLPSTLQEKVVGVRLKQLVSVPVSQEELIAGAVEVGLLPLSAAVLPRRGSLSWLRFSQQLSMALYRVLLRSIFHRRVLRKKLCRAFWAGRRLGKWLVEIRAVPIEDRPGYWCLHARIPSQCA